MPQFVRDLCVRLRDVFDATIHVVKPRGGASYPVLSLYRPDHAVVPALVLFPAWEVDARDPSRRIGFGRMVTLLRRIAEAGDRGEEIDRREQTGDATPLLVPLAVTAAEMAAVEVDLRGRLPSGASLESIEGGGLRVLRLRGPDDRVRLVLHPGWRGNVEADEDLVSGTWVLSRLKARG